MAAVKEYLSRYRLLARKSGHLTAIRYGIGWATRKFLRRELALLAPLTDVEAVYAFTLPAPFGDAALAQHIDKNTINWVIPDFGIGSGGHLNIFRLVQHLEGHGFICRIVIVGDCQFRQASDAKQSIDQHFFPLRAEVSLGAESLKPAWATIATSWPTAYTVRNFLSTAHKFYFVQDYEPDFYAKGSDYAFAQHTYDFGFKAITAGDWLANKLANEHGMETFSYGFSFDKQLYAPHPRRDPSVRRIFYYARPVTLRRGFELGLMVLEEVCRQLPDVAVILAGWDVSNYKIGFQHLNAGVVKLDELADLYSQCDLALVISLTNISLLPLELMASGCPVVSNTGPNTEWLLNTDNSVLAQPSVEALSQAIIGLLNNPERLEQLRQAGLEFSAGTDWEAEAERVANHFEYLRDAL